MTPQYRLPRRPPQFVAWDHHVASLLPDIDALVRWAQARSCTTFAAWVLDDLSEQCRMLTFARNDRGWIFTDPGRGVATVDADPSDDPRELEVVDAFAMRTWVVERTARDEWNASDPRDPLGLYAPYGFVPPQLTPKGWAVAFCPALIAEQIAWMTSKQRAAYFAAIDLRLALHVKHADADADRREQVINGHLADHGLAGLVTEVQMRVMESR